jgi:hypothetical protein
LHSTAQQITSQTLWIQMNLLRMIEQYLYGRLIR